uniref:Uncharacterized protein n=1 Tax=Rhizophora mucronata TaxID=61149 RepID=A0A2P2J0C1_RHIMU
MEYFVQFTYL